MVKMISLDTSTTHTGLAVFEDGILKWVEELITPSTMEDWRDRRKWMIKAIFDFIVLEKPDVVVAESMVVGVNPNIQRMLSEIVGAVVGASMAVNAKFYDFTPSGWRKRCLEDGEVSPEKLAGKRFGRDDWKEWSVKRVSNRYVKTDSDNVADAVLIGIAYIRSQGGLN